MRDGTNAIPGMFVNWVNDPLIRENHRPNTAKIIQYSPTAPNTVYVMWVYVNPLSPIFFRVGNISIFNTDVCKEDKDWKNRIALSLNTKAPHGILNKINAYSQSRKKRSRTRLRIKRKRISA